MMIIIMAYQAYQAYHHHNSSQIKDITIRPPWTDHSERPRSSPCPTCSRDCSRLDHNARQTWEKVAAVRLEGLFATKKWDSSPWNTCWYLAKSQNMILKSCSPSKSSQSHQTQLGFPMKNIDHIVILDHEKVGGNPPTRIHRLEVHHDLTINNGDLTMGICIGVFHVRGSELTLIQLVGFKPAQPFPVVMDYNPKQYYESYGFYYDYIVSIKYQTTWSGWWFQPYPSEKKSEWVTVGMNFHSQLFLESHFFHSMVPVTTNQIIINHH